MSVISQTHKRYLKDDDGNVYWPITSADSIIGLKGVLPTAATTTQAGLLTAADKSKLDMLKLYAVATPETDGLLSASDKAKLDKLNLEPVDTIQIRDSVSDSIFLLGVQNGVVKLTKEDKDDGG